MNQRKRIVGLALAAASMLLLAFSFSLTPAQAGENLDAPDGALEEIYDLFWDPRLFSGAVGFPSQIEWFHNPTGMPASVAQTAFETAVEASFDSWEAVDDGIPGDPLVPRATFGGVDPTAPQSATLDGVNAVVWVPGAVGGVLATTPCYKLNAATTTVDDGSGNTVFDFSASGGPVMPFPGPIGVTYPRGTMLDCGIEFDRADAWTTTGTSGYDIQSVATHEIGHFLGLSHSTVGNLQGPSPVTATMAPFGTTANTDFRSLQEDDKASLLRTYARNAILPTPQTAVGRGVIHFSLRQGPGCAPATGVSVWAYRTSEGLTGPTRIETFSGSEYRLGFGDEPYNGSVTLNVPPLPTGESYTIFARTFENDNTGSAGAFSAYRYNFTTINSNTLAPPGGSQTFDNLAVVAAISAGGTVDLGTIGILDCPNDIPGSAFDLTADSVDGPTEAAIGAQMAVISNLTNAGTAAAGPFAAGIYLSADTNLAQDDTFTGFTCSYGGLAAGASASCDGQFTVPPMIPGTYYLLLKVDLDNTVGESSESNNIISSAATVAVLPNPLDPIVNGSFETGDFSGWTIKELNQTSSNPFLKLGVAGAGVMYPDSGFGFFACGQQCYIIDYFDSAPTEGQYVALHDWNGNDTATSGAPDVNLRELYQDVSLPVEATTLEFDYRAAWELFRFGATVPRTFSVLVEPSGGGAPLISEVILAAQPAAPGPNEVDGIEEDTENPSVAGRIYPPGVVDISSVAGQDVRLKFVWDVPQPGTGFAFFQLDNVRINALQNEAPVVLLDSPSEGAAFDEGVSINFSGSASDAEDGDVTASLAWVSNVDGIIGAGSSLSYAGLSVGPHTITATATDSLGRTGSTSVGITINELPNEAPVVTITAPADGAVFTVGDTINFAATALDDEDDDISAQLSWSSNLAGAIGSGASFSTSGLGAGSHVITASVTDSDGAAGSATVGITVNPASVSDVVNPATADFSTVRGAIVAGSYVDTQELGGGVEVLREETIGGNPRKARSDLDHTWAFTVAPGTGYLFRAVGSRTANAEGDNFALSYSLDNVNFTTMATITSAIPNTYEYVFPQDVAGTVYVRIEDTDNSQGSSQLDEATIDWMAIVTLAGSGGNSAPVVSIVAPTNGATAAAGTSVSFSASATDDADGNLTANLVWTSDLEAGPIGAGGSFSTSSLSVGTHTIVASVTDSGGLTGSATVSLTIDPAGGSSISLSASGYKNKGVQYVDLSWTGNTGAVDIYRNGNIIAGNVGGGAMTDNTGNKGSGQVYVYEVCETDVTTGCSNTVAVGF